LPYKPSFEDYSFFEGVDVDCFFDVFQVKKLTSQYDVMMGVDLKKLAGSRRFLFYSPLVYACPFTDVGIHLIRM